MGFQGAGFKSGTGKELCKSIWVLNSYWLFLPVLAPSAVPIPNWL